MAQHALRPRRGAADHQQRALVGRPALRDRAGVVAGIALLLVRAVVLLVDDDQPEVVERREHRRARAHAHARLAAPHPPPLVVALALREPRVHHRHPLAEALDEAPRRLRRERDLRHQHDRRAAALERGRHRAQVDLGLAAAGDAVQEQRRRGEPSAGPASSRSSITPKAAAWSAGELHRARARAHAVDPRAARGVGGVLEPRAARAARGCGASSACSPVPARQRRGAQRGARECLQRRALARAHPRALGERRLTGGVMAARSERFGRSGRPAPVPVPGGSTSASPRAGVETYSRATHSPSATSDCGTSASSAAIGSASRSGGSSLSSATSTTTPSSRRRPNGTTSMLPTPTSSSAPASR